MLIHKNKQQCLSVPISISNYWTILADQVEALHPPESLMAIHHAAPLTKRICFSLPHDQVDHNSSTYCRRCPFLDNRTKLHLMFLAKLQQHASHEPTPLTTILRVGVLNGTIPSAVSNTGATLHALLPLAQSIPTISPMGPRQRLPPSTSSFTMYGSPSEVQTLFPPLSTILS
jgi:hypothetical protein